MPFVLDGMESSRHNVNNELWLTLVGYARQDRHIELLLDDTSQRLETEELWGDELSVMKTRARGLLNMIRSSVTSNYRSAMTTLYDL